MKKLIRNIRTRYRIKQRIRENNQKLMEIGLASDLLNTSKLLALSKHLRLSFELTCDIGEEILEIEKETYRLEKKLKK